MLRVTVSFMFLLNMTVPLVLFTDLNICNIVEFVSYNIFFGLDTYHIPGILAYKFTLKEGIGSSGHLDLHTSYECYSVKLHFVHGEKGVASVHNACHILVYG